MDPIVADVLVRMKNEGVALCSVNLDGIDCVRFDIVSIHFNDRQIVTVD